MTTQEFDIEFDILFNNISSNQSPGFDAYEKSILLTEAQEEVVLELYRNFESNEESRRYISSLERTATYQTIQDRERRNPISNMSYFFNLPSDLWFITYESVNLKDDKLKKNSEDLGVKYNVTVEPTTQDEYHRIKYNPFKNTNRWRVLRFDKEDNNIELVSKYNIHEYIVKYIVKPNPIVIGGADSWGDSSLKIRGISSNTECELHEALHPRILQLAVEKAARIWNKSL